MKLYIASTLSILLMMSCSGIGDGDTSNSKTIFGGASCESGVTLASVSSGGFDTLYNLASQQTPPVSFILDDSSSQSACASIFNTSEVFPWIRIDKDFSSSNPKDLAFQLLKPGGRNSEILKSIPISSPDAQSISGEFSYEANYEISSQGISSSILNCKFDFDGSYCPIRIGNPSRIAIENALIFSANGRVDCSVRNGDDSPETSCGGSFQANNARLDAGYYGE